MVLAALEGSLNVSDGLHRIELPRGKMMAAAEESAGGESAAGAPGPAVQGGIPGWVVLAGAAAIGGTLGGLAAADVIGGQVPVSPIVP